MKRAIRVLTRHKDGRSRKGYDTQRSGGAHHPDDLMTLFITCVSMLKIKCVTSTDGMGERTAICAARGADGRSDGDE